MRSTTSACLTFVWSIRGPPRRPRPRPRPSPASCPRSRPRSGCSCYRSYGARLRARTYRGVDGCVAAGRGERELRQEEEVGAPPFYPFRQNLGFASDFLFWFVACWVFSLGFPLTSLSFSLLCLVRRKAEDGEGCRTCSCKKSRCLKL